MKRLVLIALFAILLATSIFAYDSRTVVYTRNSCIGGDESCIAEHDDNRRLWAASAAFMGSVGGVESGGVTCTAGTYMFLYDGDGLATDYGCFTNATVEKDATTDTVDSHSADYAQYDAINENLTWAISSSDGANDDVGTAYFDFKVLTSFTGDNRLFDIRYDAANYINARTESTSSNRIYLQLDSTDGPYISHNCSATPSADTWYRVGIAWQTGADAGGSFACSMVAVGNAPSWNDDSSPDLDSWAGNPAQITLGSTNDFTVSDTVQVRDIVILSSFKATDPKEP